LRLSAVEKILDDYPGMLHFNCEDQGLPLPVDSESGDYGDDEDEDDDKVLRAQAPAELKNRKKMTGNIWPSVKWN